MIAWRKILVVKDGPHAFSDLLVVRSSVDGAEGARTRQQTASSRRRCRGGSRMAPHASTTGRPRFAAGALANALPTNTHAAVLVLDEDRDDARVRVIPVHHEPNEQW
jgi:hypothetical protein